MVCSVYGFYAVWPTSHIDKEETMQQTPGETIPFPADLVEDLKKVNDAYAAFCKAVEHLHQTVDYANNPLTAEQRSAAYRQELYAYYKASTEFHKLHPNVVLGFDNGVTPYGGVFYVIM